MLSYKAKIAVAAFIYTLSYTAFSDVITLDRVPIPGFQSQGIVEAHSGAQANANDLGIVSGTLYGNCSQGSYMYSNNTISITGVAKAVTVTWTFQPTSSDPPNKDHPCAEGLNNIELAYRSPIPSVSYKFNNGKGLTSWVVTNVVSNVPGFNPTCKFADINDDAYLTCTANISK